MNFQTARGLTDYLAQPPPLLPLSVSSTYRLCTENTEHLGLCITFLYIFLLFNYIIIHSTYITPHFHTYIQFLVIFACMSTGRQLHG